MASPFSIFRKHERVMMALICVLAMFAFVFVGPIFDTRSGRGPQDPVAAETKLYGDIHESDLMRMRAGRSLANQFVQHAMAAGYGYTTDAFFGPDTENAVVGSMLFARKAEQMGMRVTDDEITRFLQQISGDRVSGDDFAKILQFMSGGRKGHLTRRQVYDALRPELLARRFSNAFAGDASQTTPAERWESYQKLNDRARIEAIPVAVADFVDKVPDPDEKTLQEFFDRYKQFEAMPGSPMPGFKIPARWLCSISRPNMTSSTIPTR